MSMFSPTSVESKTDMYVVPSLPKAGAGRFVPSVSQLDPTSAPSGRYRQAEPLDLIVADQALDLAGCLEPIEEPLLASDVVILQVDSAKLRIRPFEPVSLPIALHQAVLRHPVQLAVQAGQDLAEIPQWCARHH